VVLATGGDNTGGGSDNGGDNTGGGSGTGGDNTGGGSGTGGDNTGGGSDTGGDNTGGGSGTGGDQNSNIPEYVEGTKYKAGDKVRNKGGIYQCKPWPYTGWCSGAAWAYGPGEGSYWQHAWIKKQ